MTDAVTVALISLAGTLAGSFSGVIVSNRLTNYRLEQLEKKVDRHNQLIERMYAAEKALALHEERIGALEGGR